MANQWVDDHIFVDILKVQKESFLKKCDVPNSMHIPHILHFIWLGSEVPEVYMRFIRGWQEAHSDWNLIVWKDAEANALMQGLNSACQKRSLHQYMNASNFGMKSDILRYEILLEYGGVYIDTDYECMGCLENQEWWSSCMAFAALSHSRAVEVNNGILGCTPGHPLLRRVVDVVSQLSLSAKEPSALRIATMSSVMSFLGAESKVLAEIDSNSAAMSTISSTGPGMLTKEIFTLLSCEDFDVTDNEAKLRTAILPTEKFHCVPNYISVNLFDDELTERLKNQWVTPETVAVHWWQKSWQQKK
jgi:hypothetical protein